MKAIDPGYKYSLSNFNDPQLRQVLQFIQKDAAGNTIEDGTTNEEVLAMLIDRLCFLQAKLPSRHTALAVTKCEEALLWLNKRTAERIERGVEGTHRV